MQQGQESGALRTDQPAGEIATLLIETFEGAALPARATGDYDAPLRHVRIAIDSLRADDR